MDKVDFLENDIKDLFSSDNPILEAKNLEGEVYRKYANRVTKKIQYKNLSYFLKFHGPVGWKEITKNLALFKLPIVGAKQEFLALSRMQILGINGPKVKSYYSKGFNPSKRNSFLITEELKGTISLEDFFLAGKHKHLSFAEKNCASVVPKHKFIDSDLSILSKITNIDKIRNFIDNQDINQYMSFIVDCLFASNKYFNDHEPWKKKEDKLRLGTIVYTSLELIRKISILLYPVMPQTTIKVLNIFNIKESEINFSSLSINEILKENNQINKLDILFKKIDK